MANITNPTDLDQRAAEAYGQIHRGDDYGAWLVLAEALSAGRQEVMSKAKGKMKGRAYNLALAEWQARNPWSQAPELEPPTPSHCYWLWKNLTDVEAWRESLPESERRSYNHPSTIHKHFGKAASGGGGAPRSAPGSSGRPNQTMVDAMQAAIDQLQAENADLRAKLAAGGGGLAGYPEFPLLWLKEPFTEEAVTAAYRRMAMACHPDYGGPDEQMAALTAERDKAIEKAKGKP
jgi:hypothetical protein